MLTHLTIKDLAIMESASINFCPSFNVITGETGSGKSIIIKALGLIFGDKSDYDLVSSTASQAMVAGSFRVSSYSNKIFELLRDHGLIDEEDKKSIVIRRVLYKKGRSHCWVNDVPVTIKTLKLVSSHLLDIFSQNEQIKLTNSQEQIAYLDQFLLGNDINFDFKNQYGICHKHLEELKKLMAEYSNKKRNLDYLEFRKIELDKLNPSLKDYEELLEYCKKATFSLKNFENLAKSKEIIDTGFSGSSLSHGVWKIKDILAKMDSLEIKQIASECESAATILDEISFNINRAVEDNEFDSTLLEKNQERLATYQSFMRKFSVSNAEELVKVKENLNQEIISISNISSELESILRKLHSQSESLEVLADRLSIERKRAKETMIFQINRELNELNMVGSKIDVAFHDVSALLPSIDLAEFDKSLQEKWADICERLVTISKDGKEKIEIFLSANPGEPPKPLSKVASGGEMSRIMLSFKNIASVHYSDYFLVFDEVDSGISGKTADIIGRKLKNLSKNCQMLCISHLPQVASYGDSHFKVFKETKQNKTNANISLLGDKDRTSEIARLLSGSEITVEGRDNAAKLIQRANSL